MNNPGSSEGDLTQRHIDTRDIGPIPVETERVASQIVDAAYHLHRRLGPGLMENVYETCFAHELAKRSLSFKRQVVLPLLYDGIRLESGLRLDLLVDERVVVELKSIENLLALHKMQLLTYLKLSGYRLGLLVNFNVPTIKEGIVRVVL